MSDNSDDDIWARVRKEAEATTPPPARQERDDLDLDLEPATRSRGSLEKRTSTEASNKLAWETTGEETDGAPLPRRRQRTKSKPTPVFLIGATVVSLMWVVGAGLFLLQNATQFGADGSTLMFSLMVLLLGPTLALLAGFMGESVAKSSRDAKLMLSAARRMLEPEKSGETAVRTTAMAVHSEIGRLEIALGAVTDRLRLIEGSVESQTTALSAAGNNAKLGADQLVATMENERHRLDALLASMAELTARAQNSTQQASQSIEDRAAKLASAADTLIDKSTHASDLAASAAQRLDVAAQRAVEAIEQLDQAAGRGETALARAHDLMVLARLRADEAVGSVGNAVTSLHDAASSASEISRVVSETIASETATGREAGAATIEEIRAATVANALMITQSLRNEADAARVAGAETLAALQASAEAVRFAADEARQQASQQMVDNQRHLDSVRQTAFEASKDADDFVHTRMTDARALIEQSAGLLDETGAKIQERFGRLAAACADQARAVEDLLDGLDRRLESLPQETDARAQAIESALADTLKRLTEAGRKAADETAALDTAFQDRLRASYSALGEVVQRLGGLSGVLGAPRQPVVPASATLPPVVQPTPVASEAPAMPLERTLPQPLRTVPQPAAPMPVTTEQNAAGAPAPQSLFVFGQPPLPRFGLKITSPVPIEDDPFEDLEIGRPPPAAGGNEGSWSWKQVLSTLDAKGAKAETGRIANLVRELSLEAAIPDRDLEKLRTAAGRSRDLGRRTTREVAPEEVRAMRRKLVSDPDLRGSIVRFVEERREAIAKGRLIGNEARVYLVADAALEA